MASWKDGAAYAPVERPDGFATPRAEPLSVAPPVEAETPGAVPHPRTLAPVDAPPLAALGEHETARRDPARPFDVQAATMAAAPTLSDGTRDPREPYALQSSSPTAEPPPPPPDQAPLPAGAAPGLPPARGRALAWLCVAMCVFGLLFPATAPIAILLAGLLAVLRVAGGANTGGVAIGIGGFLVVVQVVLPRVVEGNALVGVVALVFAVAFLVLAVRRPRRPEPSPAPPDVGAPRPGWGGGPEHRPGPPGPHDGWR